mgnify:CR=1 FL=1
MTVPYTHLRAHETREDLVCRLLLEKKKKKKKKKKKQKIHMIEIDDIQLRDAPLYPCDLVLSIC